MKSVKIALLGDRSDEVIAHRAIPLALQIAADELSLNQQGGSCTAVWIHSSKIDLSQLSQYDGIWCVPASPYADSENVLNAIRYARENDVPFLGTCGGYQHAVLEYAKNVLGYTNAGTVEEDPDTTLPLINAMFCSLVEKPGAIRLAANSQLHAIYQSNLVEEQYHCSFGVNRHYLTIFDNSELEFTGFDTNDDPRAIEHRNHPFFFGTAFQPERSALENQMHPLINAFLKAASGK